MNEQEQIFGVKFLRGKMNAVKIGLRLFLIFEGGKFIIIIKSVKKYKVLYALV